MKTSALRSFHNLNHLQKIALIEKAWASDGVDGIESLELISGINALDLAAMANLSANYARAVHRRLVKNQRRRRQPIPKGFRGDVRTLARREARGW